jgi:hypothetical protein
MKARAFALLILLLIRPAASAHIGNPTTIHEGFAGTVPVRVSVRVPGVVPGLADINVRVLTNGVTRVTALPVHWRAGLQGAPPPDVCEPVPGEPGLYHAQLWLMEHGAFSVDVAVQTERGSGKVSVPINALALTRLPMAGFLGGLLTVLGALLFALAVTAVGAALRESVLKPGEAPGRKGIWIGRAGVAIASILAAFSLRGGWNWWQIEDRDYRNNRMHRPLPALAETRNEDGRHVLRFSVVTTNLPPSSSAGWPPLVPDHGKLMHLFLVREPDMAAFAHLHPVRRGTNLFESTLPPLPAGKYSVYADVTHENGLSQTLTATAEWGEEDAAAAQRVVLSDADDSWLAGKAESGALGDGLEMIRDRGQPLVAGRETSLRFRVLDANGEPADIEPYMSMLAHAIVRSDDGSVFTHLHPAGTISVAAQQVFQLRSGEKPPRHITPEMMEKLCQPPGAGLGRLPIAFPYEFPKPGRYRIWVQVKTGGAVRTAVFDAEVKPAG